MVFRGLPSLKSLMCFYRTTRAMYSPNITLQFHDGRTKIHIYNIEISTADFELIIQHLDNVTTSRYFDRYGSDNVRYLDHVLLRYASRSLEDLRLLWPHNSISELPTCTFQLLIVFKIRFQDQRTQASYSDFYDSRACCEFDSRQRLRTCLVAGPNHCLSAKGASWHPS